MSLKHAFLAGQFAAMRKFALSLTPQQQAAFSALHQLPHQAMSDGALRFEDDQRAQIEAIMRQHGFAKQGDLVGTPPGMKDVSLPGGWGAMQRVPMSPEERAQQSPLLRRLGRAGTLVAGLARPGSFV